MPPKSIAYAALCVVVPVAWGLIVYKISSVVEKRVPRKPQPSTGEGKQPDDTVTLNYHI
jgi:hypothetical protein